MKQAQPSGLKMFISSKKVVGVLLVVLAIVLAGLIQQTNKYFKIKKDIIKLVEQIKRQEKQNLEMTKNLKYLQSEFYREKEARLKFGLQKPGERVVVITPSENQGENKLPLPEKGINNPLRWWLYFNKNSK